MKKSALALVLGLGAFACSSPPRPAEPAPSPRPAPSPVPSPSPSPARPSPAPSPSKPAEPPPLTAADLQAARSAYASGVFAAVEHHLRALRDTNRPDGALESEGRLLLRRTSLAQALLAGVRSSVLAGDTVTVETLELTTGGHVTGLELPDGRVVSFGGVETQVDEGQVLSRTKLSRLEYEAVAREHFKKHEERVKPDDALGHFRCAYWAWAYGLKPEAVPHVDAAIDSDGLPLVARTFYPARAAKLEADWRAVTGRTPASPVQAPAATPPPSPSPSPEVTAENPPAAPADLASIRALYDKGVACYRDSFGESRNPDKALAQARKLLGEARDQLDRAPDSPEAESLRVEVQSLLFDVRKRSRL